MVGISAVILIVAPVLVVSLVISLWRYRRRRVKLVALSVLVVLSVLPIVLVRDAPLPLLVTLVGPGCVIALVRLFAKPALSREPRSRA